MIPRIKKIQTKEDFKLLVEFDDGKRVIYDVNSDMNDIPSYKELKKLQGYSILFKSMLPGPVSFGQMI